MKGNAQTAHLQILLDNFEFIILPGLHALCQAVLLSMAPRPFQRYQAWTFPGREAKMLADLLAG